MSDVKKAVTESLNFYSAAVDGMDLSKGLPSREALREFLKGHRESFHPTASEMMSMGKTMAFIYYIQEAFGDRIYYYCKEDGVVYSDYFSIGD